MADSPPHPDAAAAPVTDRSPAASHRDRYDRMDVLSRSMLPIAIAVATGIFSLFQWRTEQDRQAATRMSDSVEALSKQRLAVSQLVQTFVPSLTSDKPTNRVLALQAIAYVDTALGSQLATALKSDTSAVVRVAATNVRLSAYLPLVEQVFGPTRPVRVAATDALLADRDALSDTAMVSALLDATQRHADNADGIFNSITLLRAVTPGARQAERDQILAFTRRVPTTWPRIRARADTLAAIVGGG